ncbi:MAG: class I SAM-dependent methyltransferase [Acidimicrobiia bacterium]|nr:class I SAM-dependent methyltransferase [Acidimicrobiia bacterium]
MAETDSSEYQVPLSQLPADEKAKRADSFGGVAVGYERFRPGPPGEALDWLLPERVATVVDLGAGTGLATRMLVDRADNVFAVEPDERMRSVLAERVPGACAVEGRGESIPLPDASADVVLASTSWHWMDPLPTLAEVGRVLVPGGLLGVIWSGPDPEGAFLDQARQLLAQQSQSSTESSDELGELMMGEGRRPLNTLEIPDGVPFEQPDRKTFTWDVALNADELIGLLGTFSWIINLPDDARARVFNDARRLLKEFLGVEGDVTVDLAFRAEAFRSRRVG